MNIDILHRPTALENLLAGRIWHAGRRLPMHAFNCLKALFFPRVSKKKKNRLKRTIKKNRYFGTCKLAKCLYSKIMRPIFIASGSFVLSLRL